MNIQEEIRNGYVVNSEKKKVWAVELKMLLGLNKFSKNERKNN